MKRRSSAPGPYISGMAESTRHPMLGRLVGRFNQIEGWLPLSAKISRRILSGGDWKGLLELFEEVRARVSRETGRTVDVISCYEAGYDGFWLHRLLEAHGIRNYVIDPASLQVDRRARRVKTDRIDTEGVLRSLIAFLRGG